MRSYCRRIYSVYTFLMVTSLIIIITLTVRFIIFSGKTYSEIREPYSDQVKGWPFGINRSIGNYILNGSELNLDVLPRNICNVSHFLSIFVTSSPGNIDRRMGIRNGYGAYKTIFKRNIQLNFVIGKSIYNIVNENIVRESELYNDIIRGDFIEHYNNLTLKTGVLLGAASEYCQNSHYMMKTDDDVLINLPVLIERLVINYSYDSQNLFLGLVHKKKERIADPKSKWYVPDYLYQEKVYPDYLSGPGYIMSPDIAARLYKTSFLVPINPMEDVYFTGILRQFIGLTLTNDKNFLILWGEHSTLEDCEDKIIIHEVPIIDAVGIKDFFELICSELWYKYKQKNSLWKCFR